mgnify:CR=1 FL=1
MKFVKRITTAITLLALGIICAVCAAASDEIIASDGYYEYKLADDGTATIVKYVGDDIKADVPAKIGGRNVGRVENIFNGNEKIISVTIAEGIPELADNIFSSCSSLTSVKLPSTLKAVPNGAFAHCPKLTSITIPAGITGIGEKAFYWCDALATVNMPTKLDYIGKQAFYACKSLKSISIPTGVRTIDMQTFASCMLLRNVTLPSTVTTIDQGAFEMCLSLSSINLPANLEEISANAFYFCDVLDNITIPSKVKFIGDYAFEDCASLSKINIPASVKSIGNNAFSRCGKIASITVASGNAAYCTENGALYTKDMFSLLLYPAKKAGTAFTVSAKTYTISPYAFYKAENLTSVSLPSKLVTIENNAFYGCINIKSITVPKTVNYIGTKALGFYHKLNVTADQMISGFTIRGYDKSAAQSYAAENNIPFTVLADAATPVANFYASSVNEKSAVLCWSRTSDKGYILEQYKGGKWTQIYKTAKNSDTSYTVSGLSSDATYTFRIKSYIVSGSTEKYSAYTRLAVKTPIINVSLFKATANQNTIVLSWSRNTAATGYIIEQFKGGKWKQIYVTKNNTTLGYAVSGLAEGTPYTFRLKSYRTANDKTSYSNYTAVKATTALSAMKNAVVKSTSSSAIALAWSRNANATGYIIEQYKGGKWTQIAVTKNNTTLAFTVKGLKSDTTYTFRVKAYRNIGKSTVYSPYTRLAGTTRIANVSTFTGSCSNIGAITLRWNVNNVATGYIVEVYRGGKWKQVKVIRDNSVTSAIIDGLGDNETYTFRIKSFRTENSTTKFSEYKSVKVSTGITPIG